MASLEALEKCACGSVRVGAGWCQSVRTHGAHLPQQGKWICEVCGWWNQPEVAECFSCQSQKET